MNRGELPEAEQVAALVAECSKEPEQAVSRRWAQPEVELPAWQSEERPQPPGRLEQQAEAQVRREPVGARSGDEAPPEQLAWWQRVAAEV